MSTQSTRSIINLSRATPRKVKLGQESFDVWMIDNMDKLIDDFVQVQQKDGSLSERCPFGSTLWPSGRAFAQWFAEQVKLSKIDVPPSVLELGSGVGFVSCALAKLGAGQVLATDFEPAFDAFVFKNAESFGVTGKVEFEPLDWTAPLAPQKKHAYKFVVACDVLYENSHIENLPRIASELLHREGVFYLADPERFRFAKAMEEIHKHFGSVTDTIVHAESDAFDTVQGVVNSNVKLTKVHILECRLPKSGN